VPRIQDFLRGFYAKPRGTPLLSRPGVLSTAKFAGKFPADRFDQHLTNLASDGILIIEV
jgi:hypothetical protein